MKFGEVLSFDDVRLCPRFSKIKSRSNVDLSTSIGGLKLDFPIVNSPMPSVSTSRMFYELSLEHGGLFLAHRMQSIEDQMNMLDICQFERDSAANSRGHFGVVVGVNKDWELRLQNSLEYQPDAICIDVAFGANIQTLKVLEKIYKKYSDNFKAIIVGNFASSLELKEEYEDFFQSLDYADTNKIILRVGIGGGSQCTTQVVTGHGLPTFSSVYDISQYLDNHFSMDLIADSGIKNSGDMVKSFAAGANAIMLGSLLSGTAESKGETLKFNQQLYKIYRGSASHGAKKEFLGTIDFVEGEETLVPYKGSVSKILKTLAEGMCSGLSYSGARTISELQSKAIFVKTTSAAYRESLPHGGLL